MTERYLTRGACHSKPPSDSGAMQEPMTGCAARALMQRTRTMCDPFWKISKDRCSHRRAFSSSAMTPLS